MFKTISKFIGALILSIALLVTLSLVSLKMFPQSLLWLANNTTGYNVEAEKLAVDLWPVELRATALRIKDPGPTAIAELDQLNLQMDWLAWLTGHHNFWSAAASDGEVSLAAFSSDPGTDKRVSQKETELLEIHHLLSGIHGELENIAIKLDDSSTLRIKSLSTLLSRSDAKHSHDLQQSISMGLVYLHAGGQLHLDGLLESSHEDDASRIELKLEPLDLSTLSGRKETATETTNPEAALDWSWLKSTAPLRLLIQNEKLVLDRNHLSELSLDVMLSDGIELAQFSAGMHWFVSENEYLNEELKVTGSLRPLAQSTTGADMDTELKVSTESTNFTLQGELNLNGLAGNDLYAGFELSRLPLASLTTSEESPLFQQSQQFLPLSLRAAIRSEDAKIQIHQMDINAGESDLSATIDINLVNSGVPQVRADLHARQLFYKPPPAEADPVEQGSQVDGLEAPTAGVESETPTDTAEDELVAPSAGSESVNLEDEPKKENAEKDNAVVDEKLFSAEPLDLAFLNDVKLEVAIHVDQLQYDKFTLTGLRAPVKISNGRLRIDQLVAEFADGKVLASLGATESSARIATEVNMIGEAAVEDSPDPQHRLEFDLSIQNARIDASELLPKDQLSGGVTSAEVKLTSSGLSIEQLMHAMQGSVSMEIADAEVSNSSMNLIGSDLLLEMVNTLNPFAKSDPSSKIECAVVNAQVAGGKVEFADSIAIETDKMAVVGDGRLHLDQERVDLSFNPRAQSGLGVNAGTLVKFMKIGGRLNDPKPVVSASGLLKTGVAIGAAVSTGGASLIADGLINKVPAGAACEKARNAF